MLRVKPLVEQELAVSDYHIVQDYGPTPRRRRSDVRAGVSTEVGIEMRAEVGIQVGILQVYILQVGTPSQTETGQKPTRLP